MDTRRLRQLAGILTESVTDDLGKNKTIDEFLSRFSPSEQGVYMDAIEAVYERGSEGITVSEWADYVRRIQGDIPVKEVLKTLAAEFPYIRKIGDKRYGWVGTSQEDNDDNLDKNASDLIKVTYDAVNIIKQQGELSVEEWANLLVQRWPSMTPEYARRFIDHVVGQFGGVIKQIGEGRWKYQEDPKTDSMELLRNIVNLKK